MRWASSTLVFDHGYDRDARFFFGFFGGPEHLRHFGCEIKLSPNVDDKCEALDTSARLVVVDNSEDHGSVAAHISTLKPVIQSVEKLYREQKKAEDFSRATSALETARQVAHDIRSPLAALDFLASNIDELPEEKRVLLKMSSARIKEIAEDLLSRKMPESAEKATRVANSDPLPTSRKAALSALGSVLAQVVTEKNVGYSPDGGRRVSLDEKSELYGIFIGVDSAEFKRVLSNLINNALEASPPNLGVAIRTEANSEHVQIDIVDQGCGMTGAQLAKVFESGVSFKQGGNGLGLPHAKQILVSCGGDISIASDLGVGTTVSLRIPRCPAPSWFLPAIRMTNDTKVVVVDDDPPIHQLWKIRFAQQGERAPELAHFSDPDTFASWWQTVEPSRRNRFLVLTDYEFKSTSRTGVDVLESIGGSTFAAIVTSHFEDHDILERCAAKNVKLIPKGMANVVPIVN